MQCLQASQLSNNLSVLERQRACLNAQYQQNAVNSNAAYTSIDQSFIELPEAMSMPFGDSDIASYGSVIDNNYFSNGWPDLASIQYPVVHDKVSVQENRGTDMSYNSLKKRKSENYPKPKKETSSNGSEDSSKKKTKEEAAGNKQQNSKKEVSGDVAKENSKATKTDFIHVRARRGQATDSHSLAERVRREKISERMKYLQELVPGCNKITGKAGMLDEIINYVQSLQRQVEFLSMKLTAVNPSIEFIPENFQNAEVSPLCSSSNIPVNDMSLEQLESSFPHFNSFQQASSGLGLEVIMNAQEMVLQKALGASLPVPQTFLESYLNVQGSTWDTNLNNLYGEEFNHGKSPIPPFQGIYYPNNVKMEEM